MERDIFLLLGSNEGDCLFNLMLARQFISNSAGKIITCSSLYRTAPWGKNDQPEFYNQVVEIESDQTPLQLLDAVLSIEHRLGRKRHEKWGPRIIDIDILFMGSQIITLPELQLPHPGIADRKFTLAPLAEIAEDFIHPVLNKKIKTILMECTDPLPVHRLDTE
jgi:2-amino-4-hydroxy-6-hydroxymethyldihydropteridine diphosphokinase